MHPICEVCRLKSTICSRLAAARQCSQKNSLNNVSRSERVVLRRGDVLGPTLFLTPRARPGVYVRHAEARSSCHSCSAARHASVSALSPAARRS